MSDRHHPDHSGETITVYKVDPILDSEGVTVTCPVQLPDGSLPDRYSAYHDNVSPPLEWTDVPDVAAWAVIVEDPDAPQDEPFIHWMIWNIEAGVHRLPEGLANAPKLESPQGAVQGRNGMHGYGWFGPRPPAGHGVHHYWFQVFALDAPIAMGPDTPLKDLVNALKATTLAKGEISATYEAPSQQ